MVCLQQIIAAARVRDLICAMNVIVAQASATCTRQSTTETIEYTV